MKHNYCITFTVTLFVLVLQFSLRAQTVNLTSSKLPIFIIDTHGAEIPDEPKISAGLKVLYKTSGAINYVTDTAFHYKGTIGIEKRGSSSAGYPKKQYGIEIRNSAGSDSDFSMLGLPAESDWVLYAPYSDKSCVRDVLMYNLARQLGQYASRSRYCEVILNGEYQGLYVLLEKIKRDKNRVNISKCEAPDTTGDALTGGYIYKLDKTTGADIQGWTSPYRPFTGSPFTIYYQYHYPKQEDIAAKQKSYIQTTVSAFETIMNSSSYADTGKGYPSVIDVNSFVDNFLLNEFCKNVDAYRLSSYFYKDKNSKNSKIFAGPIWDYNICFGNADYYNGWDPEGLHYTYLTTNTQFLYEDSNQPPFWWKKLLADNIFKQKILTRYTALRKTVFTDKYMFGIIDSLSSTMIEARIRNFQKWPILTSYVWPNHYIGNTYENEISYLEAWIHARINWLDSYFGYTAIEHDPLQKPAAFSLEQNFPNPFNPSTKLKYHVPQVGKVSLQIYDVLGNKIQVLVDDIVEQGTHEITFNADNLPSGVYFAHLTAGASRQVIKMLLLR